MAPVGGNHPVVVLDRIDDDQLAAVRGLVAVAEAVDGVPALNEQSQLAIEVDDERPARHLLGSSAGDGSGLVAYAHVDLSGGSDVVADAVVHPGHRRRGWGGELVRRSVEEAAPHPVLMWSHGDHPAAARLAARLGFVRVRQLWQLRRDLTAPLDPVRLPEAVRLRTFAVGVDEPAWLELNARAFAHHPEQGGLDSADLARRTGADWFDADGFFLAEREGRLIGFHWTKVHPGVGRYPPVGEVYVVGVDPDAQGGGLGRALTVAGLRYLRGRGLTEVLLYVEADNLAARHLYEELGFQHVATDSQYRHPGLPA